LGDFAQIQTREARRHVNETRLSTLRNELDLPRRERA